MGFIAAGIAVAAIGAGVAASATAKNAAAQKDAANRAAANQEGLFLRQDEALSKLIKQKEKKLYDIGNIFDRFESTGAFGDTDTLKNLRKAQNDFSQLAAGNFDGFESQLRKSMNDALVNVGQSGAPIGTYAGLAADTQMQYRKEGIQTAVGLSDFFANQSNSLLGMEFGIMDQKFNTGYQLDRERVMGKNAYRAQEAAQVGVGQQAWGGAIQSVGSSIASYGMSSAGGGSGGSGFSAPAYYDVGGSHVMSDRPSGYAPPSYYPSSQQTAMRAPAYRSSSPSYTDTAPLPMPSEYASNGQYYGDFPDQFNSGVLPPKDASFMSAYNSYGSQGVTGTAAMSSVGAKISAGY